MLLSNCIIKQTVCYCCKGQLIFKCLFGVFNSVLLQFSPKTNENFDFNTMVPQVEVFSFVLWEN